MLIQPLAAAKIIAIITLLLLFQSFQNFQNNINKTVLLTMATVFIFLEGRHENQSYQIIEDAEYKYTNEHRTHCFVWMAKR